MTGSPLVSVLMTCHNRGEYIGAAIESVLAQSYEEFELVIVDDHSDDQSVEIARGYARHDRRIRVLVNQTNLGQFSNRNYAASLAGGKFLKYHDSDDIMYPHCLTTMLLPLIAEPRAEFALSTGWHWPGGPCPMLLTPRMSYQREFLGEGMFMAGPASAMFRTEAFRALGGWPEMGVGSDYLFWLRACAKASVLLVPADLFWYRVHSAQEFQKPTAAREYAIVLAEAWRALAAPTCPLEFDELEQARRNLAYMIVKHTYRDLRAGRWSVARLRIQSAGLSWAEWLRYLRPPRRSVFAGTPRGSDGKFLMPEWPSCGGKVQSPATPLDERIRR